MKVNIIAAIGRNRELGKKSELIWDIPEDLTYFRKITGRYPVIMGAKTYFSLPDSVRPLPHRLNIVLAQPEECFLLGDAKRVASKERALQIAQESSSEKVFVIGGGMIYDLFLHDADRLYITEIDAGDDEATVFFPPYKNVFTKEVSRTSSSKGDLHYDFVVLEK